jgi:hypothetical protein
MPRETGTLKLLRTLQGLYKPGGEEVYKIAGIAKSNKLYLAYLRRVREVLGDELLREETRYRWFMRNAAEVVGVLKSVGATYALYKFRRPFEHISIDLDILVGVDDISKAIKALINRSFKIAVTEPYTVTLTIKGFVVVLFTNPSFTWVVYIDGIILIKEHAEDIELYGITARALIRLAEVAVVANHAVYKEHIALPMNCLVAWS